MHHIHHTEGIILSSSNFGETGKFYDVFTRDLGMISASAQGIRKMPSKLRYVLQDYNYVKIDFVRGKDFWRITSASKTNELESLSKRTDTLEIMTKISNLLKRLLAGEDANPELFTDLLKGFNFLEKAKTPDELRNTETTIVLRVLDNLGYIGGGEAFKNIVKSPFEENLVFEVSQNRTHILSEINKALRETHL